MRENSNLEKMISRSQSLRLSGISSAQNSLLSSIESNARGIGLTDIDVQKKQSTQLFRKKS
jgi:hypothetical protein